MSRWPTIVVLLSLAACGGADGPTPEEAGPAFPVAKTADAGPVRLTVRLSAESLSLAEALVLEEEVSAEPGFTAELPEFDASEFEGFGAVAVTESPPVEEAGRTVLRRRVTLEPERSGTLGIPPRESWFRRQGEDRESPVQSDPIPIAVAPIEDPSAAAIPEPRGLLRPEEVAAGGGPSPLLFLAGLPVLALVAILVLRRRRRPAPPPVPAHEIAFESLRRLVAAKLLEAGETERFFTVLAAILREYVERRFAVRAPERTTEEFLREAAEHEALAAHREGLRGFLTFADRVKFARHAAAESDVQTSFDTVKTFVALTAEGAHA
ncbi:MAG: hypothetical protein MUE73_19935 [Planctomycetes bacterium]|nr:hypothetical protein [Planctomycetota bacterium]